MSQPYQPTAADLERVRAQRVAQGLPPTIEDAAVYARIAAILREHRAEQERAA